MKESSTYQAILEEGDLRTRQSTLLDILRERFGEVPAEVELRIHSVTEAARLQHAILRAIRISSINDLEL